MTNYYLRDIPADLWTRVRLRAHRERHMTSRLRVTLGMSPTGRLSSRGSVRALLLAFLEAYAAGSSDR